MRRQARRSWVSCSASAGSWTASSRWARSPVVGGLFLYWHDWHLFPSFGDWISSRFGGTLTFGMVAALVALGIGGWDRRDRPCVRMLALGAEVAASGAPPPRRSPRRSGRCNGA